MDAQIASTLCRGDSFVTVVPWQGEHAALVRLAERVLLAIRLKPHSVELQPYRRSVASQVVASLLRSGQPGAIPSTRIGQINYSLTSSRDSASRDPESTDLAL